jgi:multidrug efflux pump subunit AcrB
MRCTLIHVDRRPALRRPYTFVVFALLIAVLGAMSAMTMSVDIFPSINIPVVTVIWIYSGLSPTDMRISTMSGVSSLSCSRYDWNR